MQLEDLVERLQTELGNRRGLDNRTSDYFSGSGTSTLKNGSDTNTITEYIERLQRKTDREKAQLRFDCQEKVQEQSARRSGLEERIRQLWARAQGLEAQAAGQEKLAYEHTRIQQQILASRDDNIHKPQADIQQHMDRLGEVCSHYTFPQEEVVQFRV